MCLNPLFTDECRSTVRPQEGATTTVLIVMSRQMTRRTDVPRSLQNMLVFVRGPRASCVRASRIIALLCIQNPAAQPAAAKLILTVDASLGELLCPRGVGFGTIKEEGAVVSTAASDPSVSHTKRCSSLILRIHDTLRSRPLSQCP